jgi:hypothetical protein
MGTIRGMADQFDTFKKEVEEDLQRERMRKLWQDYGTYFIAAAVAVVLAVAGWKVMESRKQASAEANAARFSAAIKGLSDSKTDDAQKALTALAEGPGGYGLMARLRLAATDAAAGRADKALAAYEAVMREPGVDPILADFARLQTAMLKADTADWTEMQNRLLDLTAEGNPWRFSARELLGLAAFRTGNLTDARGQFEKLVSDRAVPPSIAERANMVMAEIVQTELAKVNAVTPAPVVAPVVAPSVPAPVVPAKKP